ncbi:RHS repeat domain-containing protein [Tenacibaculum larymnensis]|uniref:RHS repeat-associated core domain-containing protein n=1 Tax=Tenacibaculum larymnensis TaxID=2878201 RepID=A0A9X4EMI8_9FLAO|nr:hypothetical protein [Tenacibaculum larymnensis]MDE1206387.1 hypothetical protein [Tenacibaculum larymnensis]
MKRLLTLIITIIFFGFGFAQEKENLSPEEKAKREKNIQVGNPFKKFGYTPKIATLSKGKYLEFHDLDSIVPIGSVMYNVYTQKIVSFRNLDSLGLSEATLKPEVISRWLSPDPLSDEFPDKSPYNFVNNNPIRFIDPLGLAPEDIIFLNNKEKEVARIITNDKNDIYVSVDTDLSVPSPIVIDTTVEKEQPIDAVGINFEWSLTVGGGAHGGTGFVYFLSGEDEGNLFNYDYKGSNVGLGEGFGISSYLSEFNSKEAPDSFNSVKGFGGNYNGYELSYGFGGVSYSWSNVNNTTDEIHPGMRSTWTWKSRSLGGAVGVDKSSPKLQARFFGGETYDFKQLNKKK